MWKQMWKNFLLVIFSIFTFSLSFAHEPIVTVNDLKDGRIEVIGGFSNGWISTRCWFLYSKR